MPIGLSRECGPPQAWVYRSGTAVAGPAGPGGPCLENNRGTQSRGPITNSSLKSDPIWAETGKEAPHGSGGYAVPTMAKSARGL